MREILAKIGSPVLAQNQVISPDGRKILDDINEIIKQNDDKQAEIDRLNQVAIGKELDNTIAAAQMKVANVVVEPEVI